MLIGKTSEYLLRKTRSKAKMYEYHIPDEMHIKVEDNANRLLLLSIASIGNISAEILNENNPYRIVPSEKKAELVFASRYFDAFLQSKLEPVYPQYYLLLGSIAYYLCDYIGSSKVLASRIQVDQLDLNCGGIEKILALLLQNNIEELCLQNTISQQPHFAFLSRLVEAYNSWFTKCESVNLDFIREFRASIYAQGSSRELLLTDALLAVFLIKLERSALKLLPSYSGLSVADWKKMLENGKGLCELWPAQIRLGEAGIFRGKSAVIQMPTSSGKTTSMSLAIRSSFLSKRTSLAIVVAPFRALCREVSLDLENHFRDDPNVLVNEMSDVLEIEDLEDLLETSKRGLQTIMVLTPEKLIYLLRQDIGPVKETGLIIFDEAHMFDDSTRGAQYELLISTIMMFLREDTQKLLISAVIPNADQINSWFTNGSGTVIADNTIQSTERAIAVADWERSYGYLYFLDTTSQNQLEFFVPRVIDIRPLNKLRKNEKERFFPSVNFETKKVEHNDISISLALMLNRNGGVAIFCGRKDTADSILKRTLEIGKRGIDISSFMKSSNDDECIKITHLIEENYGQKNIYYEASQKGIFAHHRGISSGIRAVIEYAMRHDLIRCIVCTSTLAQGVNLPIKYLIVTTLYQANERIKTRDFHNLIGRAGRAGVYTEGTILLSETFVYSRRQSKNESWRWNNYLEMLDPTNSESCLSQFLVLVRPKTFEISYNSSIQRDFFRWAIARYTLDDYEEKVADAKQIFEKEYPKCFNEFVQSINQLHHCLDAIESYLLSYLSDDNKSNLDTLVSATFGYFLANETEKQRMKEIFTVIKNYLFDKIETQARRMVFSRTLLPATHLLELEEWVIANSNALIACTTVSEVLQVIISQIVAYSEARRLKDIITTNEILSIANMWIEGKSYRAILDYSVQSGVQIYHRKKASSILLNDIIEICDEGFGFNSILTINAIAELLQFNCDHCEITCGLLHKLARRMRYGLPTQKSIIIYETGFGDRVVAQNLSSALCNAKINGKDAFKREIKKHYKMLANILSDYPKLFGDRLLELAEN